MPSAKDSLPSRLGSDDLGQPLGPLEGAHLSFRDYRSRVARRLRRRYGPCGSKFAMKARLSSRPLPVRFSREDLRHPVTLRTHTTDLLVFEEVFMRGVYALDLLAKPATIVDCGANVGLTSVFLANRFPEAKIIAIEPGAGNFRVCMLNCRPYPAIHPLHAAVWRTNEELRVVDPGGYHGEWGLRVERLPEQEVEIHNEAVRGLTLDRLMEDQGLDSIDLLKVDIEGAEADVFEDPSAWIDRVSVVVIECHERFRPGSEAIVRRALAEFPVQYARGENLIFAREGWLAPETAGESDH